MLAEVGHCLGEVELFQGGADPFWGEGGAIWVREGMCWGGVGSY